MSNSTGMMGFVAIGVGITPYDVGIANEGLYLILVKNGLAGYYQFEGLGSGVFGFTTCCNAERIWVPGDDLPMSAHGYRARLELKGGVTGFGTTEMTLSLYAPPSAQTNEPTYGPVKRLIQVRGLVLGAFDAVGTLIRQERDVDQFRRLILMQQPGMTNGVQG